MSENTAEKAIELSERLIDKLTQANQENADLEKRVGELEKVLRVVGVCPDLEICCYELIEEALQPKDKE